jgi:succinate dehydrogenase / fumarate reductase cytochrome b subunit
MRKNPLSTSIGSKLLIALTGLTLVIFLLFHLAGNLLVFAGENTFNSYAGALSSQPVLVIAFELGLLLIFLTHAYRAARNFLANRNARPVSYHRKEWAGSPSRKSAASSTMIVTGTIVLVFIVLHLKHFKFGGIEEHAGGLYGLEMAVFSDPLTVLFYVVSLAVIGFHLWHGCWSALQSLGLGSARYTPRLALFAKVLAVLITGGFISIPLWVYFLGGRQ